MLVDNLDNLLQWRKNHNESKMIYDVGRGNKGVVNREYAVT